MRFSQLHRTVQLRLILQFLVGFASTMVIPFLAIYFSRRVGETLTGVLYVVILLSGAIGGMLGGYYADRIGRKKLMVFSESMMFVTFLGIALVNSPWENSIVITSVLFIVNLFFSGLFGPAAQAMLLDVTTSESRKYVFTASYWLGNLAGGLGGIVGGFLFEAYHFYLFLFLAVASLISVLINLLFIKETMPPTLSQKDEGMLVVEEKIEKKKEKGFGIYLTVMKDRVFLSYILAGLLVLTIEQQLPNYIGIRLSKEVHRQAIVGFPFLHLDIDGVQLLGILRTENMLLVVVLGFLVSRLARRFKERTVLVSGVLLFAGGFAYMGVGRHLWPLIILMFVASVGELMNVPIRQALIGDLAPENARSTYISVQMLANISSGILGGLFITLGAFTSSVVMSLSFVLMGLLSAGLYFSVLTKVRRGKSEAVPTAAST